MARAPIDAGEVLKRAESSTRDTGITATNPGPGVECFRCRKIGRTGSLTTPNTNKITAARKKSSRNRIRHHVSNPGGLCIYHRGKKGKRPQQLSGKSTRQQQQPGGSIRRQQQWCSFYHTPLHGDAECQAQIMDRGTQPSATQPSSSNIRFQDAHMIPWGGPPPIEESSGAATYVPGTII